MTRLSLPGSVYQHYVYSYPHKTAYRPIEPAIPLHRLWAAENLGSLSLYLHVPFCEFRCGFCNLFTRAIPPVELAVRYLQQLRCEAEVVRSEIGEAVFARIAIGGGTPTYLDERGLEELFSILGLIGASPGYAPCGVECSPATLTQAKLDLLLDYGTERISMGVQSFSAEVCRSLGRPQDITVTRSALELLRQSTLNCLNVDLIYGADNQSPGDFVASIDELLRWSPDEVFIYPLYVRPLTGLSKHHAGAYDPAWDAHRLASYRAGRDRLLSSGYQQQSMRMFARQPRNAASRPDYCCQSDGMLGLGCGARSYTQAVHYSHEYAVGRRAVQAIIDSYLEREPEWFAAAHHGYHLNADDQQRRFALMSLLHVAGIDSQALQQRFGVLPEEILPELTELVGLELAHHEAGGWRLTEDGLERSDQIGPLLFSSTVAKRMEEHACV